MSTQIVRSERAIQATNSTGLVTARYPGRQELQENQVSQLIIADVEAGTQTLIFQSDSLVQSPNWTADGEWIVVNSLGKLWRLRADGSGGLEQVDTGDVDRINNDHLLSPDGKRVYFSAGGHPGCHLYCVSVEGGDVRRVSNDHPAEENYSYFVHGISHDEAMLAYTSVQPRGEDPRGNRNIVLIPTGGGPDVLITEGFSDNAYNGAEFSADDQWIYYNSEEAYPEKNHAQLFRMRTDGSAREQLTFDERVNWFPHFTPDGSEFVYISYPSGAESHPADMDIELRMLPAAGGEPRTVVRLFGGQGTMNCNSWASDGKRFAFFAYPSTL